MLEMREEGTPVEYVVYGDVLVAVNFIIDLLILRLCQAFTGIRQPGLRPYLAAAAGGFCSMSIFIPASSFWLDCAIRLVVSFVVVSIAYGRQRLRVFLRLLAVFYAISFLVAGVVIGLWFLWPSGGYAYGNGAVYLNLRPTALLGAVAAAYLFVRIFDRVFHWGRGMGEQYPVMAVRGGRTVTFTALADTGNRLVEPFSGKPLVVVSMEKGKLLLTPEEERWIRGGMEEGEPPPGVRVAPYTAVGGSGLLAAFRPDSLKIQVEGRWMETDGYLALSPEAGMPRGCEGIFHPRMIQLAEPAVGKHFSVRGS